MIKKYIKQKRRGFTIVELIVSVAIFAFMTALLLAKYGNFNQSVLLTNLAYDIALVIRSAQSYGLNVKSVPGSGTNYSNQFNYPYGVHLSLFESNSIFINTKITLFADVNGNNVYDVGGDVVVSTYNMKRGNKLSSLYGVNATSNYSLSAVNIIFKRPDPDATITGISSNNIIPNITYLEIAIAPPTGQVKKILITHTGMITIKD